jgi:hypothetical protein
MASPYIKFFDKDEGVFTTTSSDTVVGIIGFAKKGPLNIPTLCTSKKLFKQYFGNTPSEYPYPHLTAYKYFDQGSSVYFTRISSTNIAASYAAILSNDGTGTVAKLTSTNDYTTAGITYSGTYSIQIKVEVAYVEYVDTISVSGVSSMDSLINKLNTGISNSTALAGKVITVATAISGLNYLTIKTVAAGANDKLTLVSTGTNSLISDGSVGFSFSSLTTWGQYVAPGKAVLTGIKSFSSPINLISNYNLNFLIDGDNSTNTINIASQNQATAIGDVAISSSYVTSATSGCIPTKYNLGVSIDGTSYVVDLTGNLGVSATGGYQQWFLSSTTTTSSSTGLIRKGTCLKIGRAHV